MTTLEAIRGMRRALKAIVDDSDIVDCGNAKCESPLCAGYRALADFRSSPTKLCASTIGLVRERSDCGSTTHRTC